MSSDLVANVQLQPANPPKGHVLAHSGLLSSIRRQLYWQGSIQGYTSVEKVKFSILHIHTIYEVCKTIVLSTVLIIIVETLGSSLCLFWTLLCHTH